jgi:hypothetical protein
MTPSLRELQSGFAAAIFFGGVHEAGLLVRCAGRRPERGLAAYRSSVLANLAGAVRATYPVVESIVGEELIEAATRRYAMERPSTSGDLNAYGGDFDEFLAAYPPAAALPYLPSVARLEWRVQEVYGIADAPPQDLSELAAAAPERWGDLRFRLDPAHAVLKSAWPLARIWEVNQPGYDGDFTVDFGQAQSVLIHRRANGMSVEVLSPGEQALLSALADGQRLAHAVDEASAREGFDLQASLARFIACGLFRRAF